MHSGFLRSVGMIRAGREMRKVENLKLECCRCLGE